MGSAPRGIVPRAVTGDEARFFQTHGWVKLDQFFDPADAERLLIEMRTVMGPDAANVAYVAPNELVLDRMRQTLNSHLGLSIDRRTGGCINETFFAASHSSELGRALTALAGTPMRFMLDLAHVKMPADTSPTGAAPTGWHQDMGFSDVVQLAVWVALRDMTADHGTMRFVSAHDAVDDVKAILDDLKDDPSASYPLLEARGVVSPAFDLRAGDVTVHGGRTYHSAPPNRSGEPRWAYVITAQAASSCFDGAPNPLFEGVEGLVPGEPLPDRRFPVLR